MTDTTGEYGPKKLRDRDTKPVPVEQKTFATAAYGSKVECCFCRRIVETGTGHICEGVK